MVGTYYVYALKDTSINPAQPFYVGKGTGTRAYDHLMNVDDTAKGRRIRKVQEAGGRVLVAMLCEGLDEFQALRLEAELISAFGTEATGGILTNSVVPSGKSVPSKSDLVIPTGLREKAQIGLALLKEAVLELAKANKSGITNAETCKTLGLQTDYNGGSKDYLSWSVLGLLLAEGKLTRTDEPDRGKHIATVR